VASVGVAMVAAGAILWFVPKSTRLSVGTTGSSVILEGTF
jgi:hypothetical protein